MSIKYHPTVMNPDNRLTTQHGRVIKCLNCGRAPSGFWPQKVRPPHSLFISPYNLFCTNTANIFLLYLVCNEYKSILYAYKTELRLSLNACMKNCITRTHPHLCDSFTTHCDLFMRACTRPYYVVVTSGLR